MTMKLNASTALQTWRARHGRTRAPAHVTPAHAPQRTLRQHTRSSMPLLAAATSARGVDKRCACVRATTGNVQVTRCYVKIYNHTTIPRNTHGNVVVMMGLRLVWQLLSSAIAVGDTSS